MPPVLHFEHATAPRRQRGSWVMTRRVAPCIPDAARTGGRGSRRRLGIQIAGRLVREQEFGLGRGGAGDRDALLLAPESCAG
jgi:hypothetical protein